MKVVRIYPNTNFHTFLHSDTLWGNIIYAYRMLFGVEETTKLLTKFLSNDIPFFLSSIFPFEVNKSNKSIIYYFPRPLTAINIRDAKSPEEMTYMKEYKKVRYIEKDLFEKFLCGDYDENKLYERFYSWRKAEDELNDIVGKNINNANRINDLKKIIEQNHFNFIKGLSPNYNLHNSIDRMSGSTLQAQGRGQLYWEEEFESFGNRLNGNDETTKGIFFLVDGKEISLIEAPLRLLSHIGLGGNRSIGKGSFNYVIDDFSFKSPSTINSYVSLSLFHPNKDEIDKLKAKNNSLYYDITTRIGKVGRDFDLEFQEKNPVICFIEGSSFFVSEPLKGSIVSTAKYNEHTDIYSNYLFFGVKASLRLQ